MFSEKRFCCCFFHPLSLLAACTIGTQNQSPFQETSKQEHSIVFKPLQIRGNKTNNKHIDYIHEYKSILKSCIQKDRGMSIPDCPIGCDFEVGEDYSMGKFAKQYET